MKNNDEFHFVTLKNLIIDYEVLRITLSQTNTDANQ